MHLSPFAWGFTPKLLLQGVYHPTGLHRFGSGSPIDKSVSSITSTHSPSMQRQSLDIPTRYKSCGKFSASGGLGKWFFAKGLDLSKRCIFLGVDSFSSLFNHCSFRKAAVFSWFPEVFYRKTGGGFPSAPLGASPLRQAQTIWPRQVT